MDPWIVPDHQIGYVVSLSKISVVAYRVPLGTVSTEGDCCSTIYLDLYVECFCSMWYLDHIHVDGIKLGREESYERRHQCD